MPRALKVFANASGFILAFAPAAAQIPPLVAVEMNHGTIYGVSEFDQVGIAGDAYAARWQYPFGVPWQSSTPFEEIRATDGVEGVGYRNVRASHWSFSSIPPTVTNLHLVKFKQFNSANAKFGGEIAGWATQTGFMAGDTVAVYWPFRNTRPAILHPNGYAQSVATGITLNYQVGYATQGGNTYAAVWNKRANTFRNLNPPGATQSWINGAYAHYGVGVAFDPFVRAAMWDLNSGTQIPIQGPTPSAAYAIQADLAVGSYGNSPRAIVWNLYSPGTYVDLHDLLPPGKYSESAALCVFRNNSTGATSIGGYARLISEDVRIAILWTNPPS